MPLSDRPNLPFLKMQGIGNDFVVLDGIANPLPAAFDYAEAARDFCDRHRGVGADGLLLLGRAVSRQAAISMRMWNPDGSEDMCGNGLRCIARLAHLRGYAGADFEVDTLSGTRAAGIEAGGDITVSMGQPNFSPAAIPLSSLWPATWSPQQYTLEIDDTALQCSSLTTGSTHTVAWVDRLPGDAEFARLSPLIETHDFFPAATSVMWARVIDRGNLELRIWERGGCGETLACGTGACAAAVAGIATGRCDSPVQVHSRGGKLSIVWSAGEVIAMTGDARVVYQGNWPL